jgi:hypothetical protein
MRVNRLLALVLIALAAPLSRAAAQTCQGLSAFQDGRWRAAAADQNNSDFNAFSVGAAYGIQRSFYANVDYEATNVSHGGPTSSGVGANVGYQIHLSDTPFQFCPSVMGSYSSTSGAHTSEYGLGGSLGYRVAISDWFTLVPAAGVRWMSATTTVTDVIVVGGSGSTNVSATGSSSEVFMTMGFVFNAMFTINPGVVVPAQRGAKTSYTLGVSINWAK